jgi:DNA polymerase
MSDPRKVGEEILQHLRFYQELEVQWIGGRAAAPARIPSTPSVASPKAGLMGKTGTPKAPAERTTLHIPQTRTMFDADPGREESLGQIREDLGDCKRCKLASSRRNIVFGSGNPAAELMFVGEAPGADEDDQGLPFVGRAGQLLTKIIASIGMKREEVYICNILKCRPPGNRNPETDEIASCEPFLMRQIASVKPKVICALGTFGAQTLLRTREPISRLRGHFIDFRGAKFLATFHPAYLLRNPNEKRKVWEDVQKIRDYLNSLRKP